MTRQILNACCLILLLSICAFAQRERSTLLPESEVKAVTKQCSRPSPTNVTGTWKPSAEEIKEMESRLGDIRKLKVLECCMIGAKVSDPESDYLQYAGIVVKRKKLIYINGISRSDPGASWKEKAVVICDGGNAWGVLYNPRTRKFFGLAMNGVG